MDINKRITGRVWKCADAVTTYQIIEQQYWNMVNPEPDAKAMGMHAFASIRSADRVPEEYAAAHAEIIVAGRNFGCGGKSIVHPVAALQGAGVRLVIAESFSRYFFRNAVNNDLPVLVCPGIMDMTHSGDRLSVELASGCVQNETTGRTLYAKKPAQLTLDILRAGGEIAFYCNALEKSGNKI